MDEKRLQEIEARASNATPAPWETSESNTTTVDEAAKWAADHVRNGPGVKVFGVWCPEHPLTEIGLDRNAPRHAVQACITGNGPGSELNAEFIAAARVDVPELVATVRQQNILLELAWGVIANAGGGDWTRESADWQEAAAKWRDAYHRDDVYAAGNDAGLPVSPQRPSLPKAEPDGNPVHSPEYYLSARTDAGGPRCQQQLVLQCILPAGHTPARHMTDLGAERAALLEQVKALKAKVAELEAAVPR